MGNDVSKQRAAGRSASRTVVAALAIGMTALLSLGAGAGCAVLSLADRGEVAAACHGDPAAVYDGVAYNVDVIWGPTVPNLFLAGPRLFEVNVTRAGNPGYGHTVYVHPLGADPRTARCTFDVDGVRVAFDTGHTLFIPKKSFLGGR